MVCYDPREIERDLYSQTAYTPHATMWKNEIYSRRSGISVHITRMTEKVKRNHKSFSYLCLEGDKLFLKSSFLR